MANLRSIFRSIDTGNSGYIDKSDIGRLLQSLEPSATVTQNDVLFVINEVDLTHDERLSFVEFRKWYIRARKVRAVRGVVCWRRRGCGAPPGECPAHTSNACARYFVRR